MLQNSSQLLLGCFWSYFNNVIFLNSYKSTKTDLVQFSKLNAKLTIFAFIDFNDDSNIFFLRFLSLTGYANFSCFRDKCTFHFETFISEFQLKEAFGRSFISSFPCFSDFHLASFDLQLFFDFFLHLFFCRTLKDTSRRQRQG